MFPEIHKLSVAYLSGRAASHRSAQAYFMGPKFRPLYPGEDQKARAALEAASAASYERLAAEAAIYLKEVDPLAVVAAVATECGGDVDAAVAAAIVWMGVWGRRLPSADEIKYHTRGFCAAAAAAEYYRRNHGTWYKTQFEPWGSCKRFGWFKPGFAGEISAEEYKAMKLAATWVAECRSYPA